MFYLIDEKDGLKDDFILVNTANLARFEVLTGKKNVSIAFYNKKDNDATEFVFELEDLFEVNVTMHNITNLRSVEYTNDFIMVTDEENIEYVRTEYQSNQELMNKVRYSLVNIHEIFLATLEDNNYYLYTNDKKMNIAESPLQVYEKIQEKMKLRENKLAKISL